MTATDLDAWRGVAAEGSDDLSSETTVRLQERSRRLLGSLLRPHRRTLWYAVVLLLVQNAAAMAGPLLVAVGIDKAIPAIDDGRGAALLVGVTVALVVAAVPRLRPVPAALAGVPRALHVRPGHLPADERRGRDR